MLTIKTRPVRQLFTQVIKIVSFDMSFQNFAIINQAIE